MEKAIGTPQTISGIGNAESKKYRKVLSKDGTIYLIAVGKFAADNIYVDGGPGSRGFAGATLEFPLEDGTVIKLKGPWHTNADDLLKHTGVDIRDKHSTRVTIALETNQGWPTTIVKEILYDDKEFVEGFFDRGTNMAKEFVRKLGKPVFYHVETGGGAHSGWMSVEEAQ